ncbi:MAG: hypothetical protein ABIK62_07005, partial [candidate division WOR-3 bacterium]
LLPGTIYQCTLVFHHRGLSLWSFELSTVDSLSRQAGGCIITDPRHTTLDTLLGVIYLKNTLRGVFLGQPDSARWAFAYASPDCNIGPVSFYWTGYLSRRTSRRNYHIVENSITLPQRLDPEE